MENVTPQSCPAEIFPIPTSSLSLETALGQHRALGLTENLHLAPSTNTAYRYFPEPWLLSSLPPLVPAHSVSTCSTNPQCPGAEI